MSSRSISAPRWDMLPRIFSTTRVLDAAQGELELLLVDLAQHELQVAVLQDDEVLEGEQAQLDLVGQLLVGLADGADDVALGRAPRAVEDLGQGVDAAGGRELLADDVGELQAQALLDVADDVRVGLAHGRDAQGDVGLQLGLSSASTRAARVECTLATHEGDGLRRLVLQEGVDLLGRRAAQELERARLGLRA